LTELLQMCISYRVMEAWLGYNRRFVVQRFFEAKAWCFSPSGGDLYGCGNPFRVSFLIILYRFGRVGLFIKRGENLFWGVSK
jgi:hypothetical protein